MVIDPETIDAAFEQHKWRYAKRERAWNVPHHVTLWQKADTAFDDRSEPLFQEIYEDLRKIWKAFRGGQSRLSSSETFALLNQLDPSFRQRRLTELQDAEIADLWKLLESVQHIKKNKYGPSVVAISKLLHFWNPRLFVIVDDGVVWNKVLDRWWLWDEMKTVRQSIDMQLFKCDQSHNDDVCDLCSYLAILVWCRDLLRENPYISMGFNHYLRSACEGKKLTIRNDYDAAAIEWLLLGLVHLLPPGVHLKLASSPGA